MGKIVYRVYGYDKFSRESYLVGQYDTRWEADLKLRSCQAAAKSQPASLRDTYTVGQMTREEAEFADEHDDDWNW